MDRRGDIPIPREDTDETVIEYPQMRGMGVLAKIGLLCGVVSVIVVAVSYVANSQRSLLSAAEGGNTFACRLLLRWANPNEDFNGQYPLNAAAREGHVNVVRLLLERGASVNHGTSGSALSNALMFISSDTSDPRTAARLQVAKLLLQNGADPNGMAGVEDTSFRPFVPIVQAAEAGDLELLTLLLDRGADINATDSTGETALTEAIRFRHKEVVAYLLDRGANANQRRKTQDDTYHLYETPLAVALKACERDNCSFDERSSATYKEIILLLLKRDANSDEVIGSWLGHPETPATFATRLRVPEEIRKLLVAR